jgi:hypothetical protein
MEPHWVNICDRKPDGGKEVQVLVIQRINLSEDHDIGYERAKLTAPNRWEFSQEPQYRNIAAWLESDRILSREELSNVPKGGIRF